VLDQKWPIREADIRGIRRHVRKVPDSDNGRGAASDRLVSEAGSGSLFDHFSRLDQKRVRHRKTKRFRCLEIDDQIEFGRLLDRQPAGLTPSRIFLTK
jgi:hypothetical protein